MPMKLYLDAFGLFRQRFSVLIACEVLFKLLSLVLLAPLTAAALALMVTLSGSAAISNQDIIDFLLSPLGVLVLAATGTLYFTLVFLEQAGLVLLASAPMTGQRVTVLGALLRTGWMSPRLLRLGLIQFGGYFLALVPFALVGVLVYHFLLSDRDINYYLEARPPRFWVALGLGTLLAIGFGVTALLLFVRWLFALPLALLRDHGAYASMHESARLARRFFWSAFPPLALWFAIMIALALAGALVLDVVNSIVLAAPDDHPRWIIVAAAFLVALHAVAALLWSALLFLGTCVLVLTLYERAAARAGIAYTTVSRPMPDRVLTRRERWSLRAIIGLATAVLVTLSLLSAFSLVETVDMPERVQITAHRGGSLLAPENTLSAFRAAIDMKADFAELDVQETADGEVVGLHDADLARVAGIPKRIWQVTSAELKKIDAGSWFSTKFGGERIPTLAEVIDLAQGKIKLMIELKYNGHDQKLAQRVVDLIAQKKFENQCVITSLKYAGLREVKKLNPRLKVGLLVAKSMGRLDRLQVDIISLQSRLVSQGLVEFLHRAGKQVHAWTLNSRDKIDAMIAMGVDNLITDRPELAREVLNERQTLTNTERLLFSWQLRLKE